MNFEDKTVIFLGSSVTDGNGYSMCEHTGEVLGCKTVKWALSGTTLADVDEKSYVSRLKKHISEQDKCDLFICQLSTNDAGRKLPLGEISDSNSKESFDTKTVIGAIEYIIATVKEKYACKIAFYTGSYFNKAHYALMVSALLEVAKKWQIDVIDLWNDKEMQRSTVEDYWRYMGDPVHPTRLGYREWWGPKFIGYIEKNL